MLNHPTLEKLKCLKLIGMAEGLEEQMASSRYDSLSFEERLGLLVDFESTQRDDRRIQSRLKQASLRQSACLEDVCHSSKRGLDPSLVRSLADCRWIKEGLNVLITGATGVGKSWLACALGHQACLKGYKTKYYRASRLFEELELARGDGRYPKLMRAISRLNLIIIDDWGLSPLKEHERRDMLEILEDRYGNASTIIAGQIPVEHWHDIIGNPTFADAIMDRLVHQAYKIELDGDTMRKKKN
jgi:DNA replication protein DnaC